MCHKVMELEDPKDLQARFRKFLILTNERKKMSKTTLRKRISLVAVTALTAGLISVVGAPAASANIAAGTPTQAVVTVDTLNVAVIASTTGAAVTPAPQLAAPSNRSLGLIYKDASSTTAQSATMLGTGALSLYTKAATIISLVATGGSFSGAVDSLTAQTNAPQVASNLRGILTNGTATDIGVTWTPGAVGTYTISAYKHDGVVSPSATLGLARGTLFAQITVTAVAAGNAGTYSPTYTLCNVGATATTATGVDASGASAKNNGATAFINFTLADAYGTQLAAGLPVVASLTGSAILDIASTASSAISTSDVDATVTAGTVSVKQAVANAPATATVTLSYNGTTVCTKTVTFAGEVASLRAVAVRTQTTSSGNEIVTEPLNGLGGGTIRVEAFDASGAKVNPLTAGGGAATHTQFGVVAASVDSTVTGVTFYSGAVATGTASTDASGLWPLAFTQASHACATQGSNAGLRVTFQNPSGTIITSPAFSARCASAAVSYTASWDKASYVQGDIAKLTVQFKDIKGNNAPSSGAATKGTVTGATATITAPMMTLVGTLTNNTAVDVNGAIVYTYTVGTTGTFTDGSYNSIVDFPALSGTTGSVQTATYKVASSATPGVSNADVLKSIVALIASINKQIQALQKLILRR